MSKYLVTGGAGFIGSHIAERLIADGHSVRVLDNLSTGRLSNLESLKDDIEWIEGDIRDTSAVNKAVGGVDFVIHQAALASVPRSIADPSPTNETNVQGTLNILEAARQHDVKKVVYASSSSVYGDSEVLPKIESMATNPKSPYAVSKLAGELYCRTYSSVHKLPTVSLRYFNVFGPRQDPTSEYSAVVPLFVSSLIEGRAPTIYGDGKQSRDFTYIDNVVTANIASCESTLPGGEVYNVACGARFTLNDLYDRLGQVIGTRLEPKYDAPRAGDVRHSEASIDRITKDLNYAVEVGFDEGLQQTVDWYREAGLAA